MYKNNSRGISKPACLPAGRLIGKCHAVDYYSYTNRYPILKNKEDGRYAILR